MALQRLMFQSFLVKQIFIRIQIRHRSSSISTSQWDLFSAICLQRCPIMVPELNWIEKRMQEIFQRVEIANSLYSEHEIRHIEDLKRAQRIASGVDVTQKDLEEASKQTAQDFEEASLKELKQFKFGDSITKADLSKNEKSIDRFLSKYLYLTIKTKIGANEYWIFPQEKHQPNESLRETAERALEKCFPTKNSIPSVYVKFIGNCPSALYSYRYPTKLAEQTEKFGSRIFLFKCEFDVNKSNQPASQGPFGDRILEPSNCLDYLWLTRNELKKQMPEQYWRSFGKVIYTDNLVNIEKFETKQRKIAKFKKLENLG